MFQNELLTKLSKRGTKVAGIELALFHILVAMMGTMCAKELAKGFG